MPQMRQRAAGDAMWHLQEVVPPQEPLVNSALAAGTRLRCRAAHKDKWLSATQRPPHCWRLEVFHGAPSGCCVLYLPCAPLN